MIPGLIPGNIRSDGGAASFADFNHAMPPIHDPQGNGSMADMSIPKPFRTARHRFPGSTAMSLVALAAR
ncbi:hypothetical protein [Azospirillum doebereinerae]